MYQNLITGYATLIPYKGFAKYYSWHNLFMLIKDLGF